MPWNIFDQSHRITYDNGTSGYWQRLAPPALMNLRQPILDHAREFLGQINDFSKEDYLVCVYADKTHCHLVRVHNGGQDNKGRPQRLIFLVWTTPLVAGFSLDLSAWLNDPAWPAMEPVPLPMPVPEQPYVLPNGSKSAALSDHSSKWADWLANPNREEIGWVLIGEFKGTRLTRESLPLHEISRNPTAQDTVPLSASPSSLEIPLAQHEIGDITLLTKLSPGTQSARWKYLIGRRQMILIGFAFLLLLIEILEVKIKSLSMLVDYITGLIP